MPRVVALLALLVLLGCTSASDPSVEDSDVPTLPDRDGVLHWPHLPRLDLTPLDRETDPPPPQGALFEDVTASAGLGHRGTSYGMGWGDLNGDGLPDLWVGNHADPPSVYVNLGGGRFEDRANTLLPQDRIYIDDAHGVVWLDLDRDGDQDLIEVVGANSGTGEGPNLVWRNEGEAFAEVGAALGLDLPLGSGRCPVPVDWNRDGRVDVVLINQTRADGFGPTSLFTQQEDGTFTLQSEVEPASLHPTDLCGRLADLDGDRVMELVRFSKPSHLSAHDLRDGTFRDVSVEVGLPSTTLLHDLAIGDFDNDLRNDLYVVRWKEVSEGLHDPTVPRLRMTLRVDDTAEGVLFRSDGEIEVSLDPPWFWGPSQPRVGPDCFRPFQLSFTVRPDDPGVQGVCPFVPGQDQGLYVGREGDAWVVMLSVAVWERGNVDITSTAPFQDVVWRFPQLAPSELVGFNTDQLWMGGGTGYAQEGTARGIDLPTQCSSVATGDLDNDMDLDLFLTCASPVQNTPDLIYLNDGAGQFTLFTALHGAEGATAGRSDTAILADQDLDGFLDVFVTNGFAAPPMASRGPHQLFRNRGNENHWLQLDLRGTRSNVDAIGATVIVTAGGVSQLREVGGETHHMGQHFRRVHVGLGANEAADEVRIVWPDGGEQVLTGVGADRVVEVVEL
jgi:hypothetical protein